jgi:hypothetical protein
LKECAFRRAPPLRKINGRHMRSELLFIGSQATAGKKTTKTVPAFGKVLTIDEVPVPALDPGVTNLKQGDPAGIA